jgi:hypothetical protein
MLIVGSTLPRGILLQLHASANGAPLGSLSKGLSPCKKERHSKVPRDFRPSPPRPATSPPPPPRRPRPLTPRRLPAARCAASPPPGGARGCGRVPGASAAKKKARARCERDAIARAF